MRVGAAAVLVAAAALVASLPMDPTEMVDETGFAHDPREDRLDQIEQEVDDAVDDSPSPPFAPPPPHVEAESHARATLEWWCNSTTHRRTRPCVRHREAVARESISPLCVGSKACPVGFEPGPGEYECTATTYTGPCDANSHFPVLSYDTPSSRLMWAYECQTSWPACAASHSSDKCMGVAACPDGFETIGNFDCRATTYDGPCNATSHFPPRDYDTPSSRLKWAAHCRASWSACAAAASDKCMDATACPDGFEPRGDYECKATSYDGPCDAHSHFAPHDYDTLSSRLVWAYRCRASWPACESSVAAQCVGPSACPDGFQPVQGPAVTAASSPGYECKATTYSGPCNARSSFALDDYPTPASRLKWARKCETAWPACADDGAVEVVEAEEALRRSRLSTASVLGEAVHDLVHTGEAAAERDRLVEQRDREHMRHDAWLASIARMREHFCSLQSDEKVAARSHYFACVAAKLTRSVVDARNEHGSEPTDEQRAALLLRLQELGVDVGEAERQRQSHEMHAEYCALPEVLDSPLCVSWARGHELQRVREWFCASQPTANGHERFAACQRLAIKRAQADLAAAGLPMSVDEYDSRVDRIRAAVSAEEEEAQTREIAKDWCAQPAQEGGAFCRAWTDRHDKEL